MSIRHQVLTRVVMPLMFRKGRFAEPEQTRRDVAARAAAPASHEPPRRIRRELRVAETRHGDWPVYELEPHAAVPLTGGAAVSPTEGAAVSPTEVIYFHGGSYITEISSWQWSLAGAIAAKTPAQTIVPIYPRGDAIGAAATVEIATALTRQRLERSGAESVVVAGDSAGGGLALAVAQTLRDEGLHPRRLVLISPWLDVATDLPEQRELEARDRMLSIGWSSAAGRLYARELPVEDPRVSPIHGEMRGLPPIAVFTSTDDLLNPDSRRLKEACDEAGVPIDYFEAPGMPHGYPILPTPEGRAARARVIEALRR